MNDAETKNLPITVADAHLLLAFIEAGLKQTASFASANNALYLAEKIVAVYPMLVSSGPQKAAA